jgi:Zn-dependent M32 family carboxypeptidase
MALNYTETEVELMLNKYQANPTREVVEELASDLDKSIKSIIGKLSREGVYKKAVYRTKTGELPITKADIIVKISNILGADSSKLIGLEKAPKQELKYLLEKVGGEL